MTKEQIREELFRHKDEKYRIFNSSLIPSLPEHRFIGVRVPILRDMARKIVRNGEACQVLQSLGHDFFEEDMLQGLIISRMNVNSALPFLESFFPFVDNWAVCDSISPKPLDTERELLLQSSLKWLGSTHTYTVRFGILMLMKHFLDENFRPEYALSVAEIKSDEYYIRMMQAWYFATALSKRYDDVIGYIEGRTLSDFVHKMTIRKATESRLISDDVKAYLKTLR